MTSTQASDHVDLSSAIHTEEPGGHVPLESVTESDTVLRSSWMLIRFVTSVVFVHSPGCYFEWSENCSLAWGNRELLYHYDADFTTFFDDGSSGRSFFAIADDFLKWLHQARSSSPRRPLAIVSYQLGGLLVKEALLRCQQRAQKHLSGNEDIFDSICGLVFIGCPHRGGIDASLVEIIATMLRRSQIDTAASVIEDMRKHADAVKKKSEDFIEFLEAKSPMLMVWSVEERYKLKDGDIENVVDETLTFKHRYEHTKSTGRVLKMSKNHRYYGGELEEAFREFRSCSRRASKLLANKVHFLVPFEHNLNFVGRKSEIERLRSSLLGHPERFSEVVLSGSAGIGKSEIAVELAYQLCGQPRDADETSTPALYWLRASSYATVESDVRMISQRIDLMSKHHHLREAQGDIFVLFRDWFQSKYSGRWILIFDENYDDSVLFNNFAPFITLPYTSRIRRLHDLMPRKPGCAILYVCQDSCSAEKLLKRSDSSDVVTIPKMASEECVMLVKHKLGSFMTEQDLESQDPAILNLVDVLDNSPLALVCATSYMRTLRQTPNTYLRDYRTNASALGLVSTVAIPEQVEETEVASPVLQAIRLSVSHVMRLDMDIAKLLHFLIILNQAELPMWLLREVIQPLDTKALEVLIDFSIISVSANGQVLRMHTLVRSLILESVDRGKWLQSLRETALGLCHVFMEFPDDIGYYTNVKTVASTLAALGDEAQIEEVLERFGASFETWAGHKEPMQTIRSIFGRVVSGDLDTLREMMRWVQCMGIGSVTIFEYLGKNPSARRYRYD